jgi:hypothetical protein
VSVREDFDEWLQLVLEQATVKGTPLAMVDIDFSKAYDTVDRFVKE